jgi:hypothetical protein
VIVHVLRKPLTGTVAANALQHGCGALNIDGCRIGFSAGRWPANLVHDGSDEVLSLFPETSSGKMNQEIKGGKFSIFGKRNPRYFETIGDSGSASRFFQQVTIK